MNGHPDPEQEEDSDGGCYGLQFHTDLVRQTATQIIRRRRTPIWRGLKILAFSLNDHMFKYEGIDAKGKKLVTVVIPFVQVNAIQAYSRRIKKRSTNKTQMQILLHPSHSLLSVAPPPLSIFYELHL